MNSVTAGIRSLFQVFATCCLPVLLAACATVAQAQNCPTGIGIFMTDTRQARWQMDNYKLPESEWIGNEYDPPCCIGPACAKQCPCGSGCVNEYPKSSLIDTVQFLKDQGIDYTIVKIAEGEKITPQAKSLETTAAFAQVEMPVYGYHKLNASPGDKQAAAVIEAFKTWPALSGLVIMPGDPFYDLYSEGQQKLADQIASQYVSILMREKTSGVLKNKVILYAPEQADSSDRKSAHIMFGKTLGDAVMPRTFWLKNTDYGTTDPMEPLYRRETQMRHVWGLRDPQFQPDWWVGRPLVLWAQTDMLVHGNRSRIKAFVDRVRSERAGAQAVTPVKKYRQLQGLVIWEWAHMNRAEIDELASIEW